MFVMCSQTSCIVNVEHIVSVYVDGHAVTAELDNAVGKQQSVELGYYSDEKAARVAFDELVLAIARGGENVYRMLTDTEILRKLGDIR